MSKSELIPNAVAVRAVEWHIDLQAGDASVAGLERWLQEDNLHQQAWDHIQNTNKQLQLLDSPAARQAMLTPHGKHRRRAIKALCSILFVGASGAILQRQPEVQSMFADLHTQTGERLHRILDDGSRIDLNSATAVSLLVSADRIQIQLIKGEVLITTAKALGMEESTATNRISVLTRQGELFPLGTRFTVTQEENHTEVAVFDGAVAVHLQQAETPTGVIHAGNRAQVTSTQLSSFQTADASSAAWTEGMLIAASMPLAVFLKKLSQHREGYLGCAPSIAHLPVSGTYPLSDTNKILDALTRTLPVKLSRYTQLWVRVIPR